MFSVDFVTWNNVSQKVLLKIKILRLFLKDRAVRRKDREITEFAEIKNIFDKAKVLRIALNNGEYPYIFPVNFGYETDGENFILFFHGSKEGTKHEIIRKNNRVAFEIDCEHQLVLPLGKKSCTTSFAYESIIGQGIVEKAAEEEKEYMLIALLKHYGITADTFDRAHLANTVVYKIKVLYYSAKRRKAER